MQTLRIPDSNLGILAIGHAIAAQQGRSESREVIDQLGRSAELLHHPINQRVDLYHPSHLEKVRKMFF